MSIFARQNEGAEPYTFSEANIKVHYSPHFIRNSKFRNRLARYKLRTVVNIFDLLFFICQSLWVMFRTSQNHQSRATYIGIDTNGAICAWAVSVLTRSKIAYLSLEMTLVEKYKNLDRIRLFLERFAFRKSRCVIVQDENRFRKLCKTHRFDHPHPLYVANSSYQPPAEEYEVGPKKSDFFRRKLRIGSTEFGCLVLHAGMICDEVLSRKIAKTFRNVITSQYALIMHERFKRSEEDPYIRELRKLNDRNLFLSLEPLPFDEIEEVFLSADVGLVMYSERDKNFTNIGKASGKLAQYLRFGLPVIMNAFPSLLELNDKYKFGEAVLDPTNPAEFAHCLEKIMNDYGTYRNNALNCYRAEFDMEPQFAPFFELLTK